MTIYKHKINIGFCFLIFLNSTLVYIENSACEHALKDAVRYDLLLFSAELMCSGERDCHQTTAHHWLICR